MRCSDVTPLLSLYVDEQLEAKQMEKLKKHIESCDICRQELEELKELIASISSEALQLALPSDFKQKLHERLEREAAKIAAERKSSFRVVLDKINQHKRIPISIGIAAACALIMFNTGIFDTMKPTDYNNHQTTQIKQNAPETAMPDKAPTQGGDNSSQTESIPSNQQDNKSSDGYNTPVEDNLPKESEKPIDKEKTFENEQPQKQSADIPLQDDKKIETITPENNTPGKAAANNNQPAAEAPAATNAPLNIFSAGGGNADDKSVGGGTGDSSVRLDAARTFLAENDSITNAMYVRTGDLNAVMDALADFKHKFTAQKGGYVLSLNEEEFKKAESIINESDLNLEITYEFEEDIDAENAYKIVIVGER